jgi:hypothetical protein
MQELALMNRGGRVAAKLILAVTVWVAVTGVTLTAVVSGQENEAALRARIVELQDENQTLRTLLQEIKSVLANTPAVLKQPTAAAAGLRMFIEPGEWGSSSLADIKKVCESAGQAFMPHLNQPIAAPLLIQNDGSGPITLYRRGQNNEHIVRLNTDDRAWAQLAFQFSHELCHVMCNYRNVENKQLWFEETLCECASLFALRQMGENWKKNPPYSNWKSYSSSLKDYAAQRLNTQDGNSDDLAKIYRKHREELEASATNRELNNILAAKLLPLFEKTPSGWEAVRYINRGPAEENTTFESYVTGWHKRVPPQQKAFVEELATKFGVALDN